MLQGKILGIVMVMIVNAVCLGVSGLREKLGSGMEAAKEASKRGNRLRTRWVFVPGSGWSCGGEFAARTDLVDEKSKFYRGKIGKILSLLYVALQLDINDKIK